MDSAAVAILGDVASALFSAYFIGSFAFVAYVFRKYDTLKDDLRGLRGRIEHLETVEVFVKGYAAKSIGREGASDE